MGKISNTSQYPTVVPQSADYVIGTDADDAKKTKTFTIGSMGGAVLTGLPSAVLAFDDKFIGLDTSDSDAPKQFLVSTAVGVMLSSLPTATIAANDFIVGVDTGATPRKFALAEVRGGYAKIFESQCDTNQTTTSTAAQDIFFGLAQDTTDISIDVNGLITFKTTGDYFVVSDFQVGVDVADTNVHLRYLIDNVQIGSTLSEVVNDTTTRCTVPFSFPIKITSPNTLLKFQYAVEGTGANGGLKQLTVNTTGFNESSSGGVIIYKRQ